MRVLVVEDEHRIANSLRKGLEQESMAVDVAYDGEKGFDLAASEDYDVIILDIMLPLMDGIEICRKLRDEEGIHTPILMLTAKGQVEDKVNGLNAGADDYLAKPFALEELLARVRALARRPKKTLSREYVVDDLVLNVVEKEVRRGDRVVKLSKKEFALLEYLMKNKGQVLSKDKIINHVWNFDADVLPNTVEVYIGYLRSKIDLGLKKKSLIKTVRGFGYKMGEK